MTNLKGATRHRFCYGNYGKSGTNCVKCLDTKEMLSLYEQLKAALQAVDEIPRD